MRRPGSAPTENKTGVERRMAVDPICKMEVDPKTAKWKSTYNGKEYYFCAPGCKKTFDKNPGKYA
jgi:YHS domain-containing protein